MTNNLMEMDCATMAPCRRRPPFAAHKVIMAVPRANNSSVLNTTSSTSSSNNSNSKKTAATRAMSRTSSARLRSNLFRKLGIAPSSSSSTTTTNNNNNYNTISVTPPFSPPWSTATTTAVLPMMDNYTPQYHAPPRRSLLGNLQVTRIPLKGDDILEEKEQPPCLVEDRHHHHHHHQQQQEVNTVYQAMENLWPRRSITEMSCPSQFADSILLGQDLDMRHNSESVAMMTAATTEARDSCSPLTTREDSCWSPTRRTHGRRIRFDSNVTAVSIPNRLQ